MELIFDDVKVGDRFRLLYPLERGDGIEFPEGAEFHVTEVSQHPEGSDVWHCIALRCAEAGYHWKALPVSIPPHQPDYLHYLNIRIETLNKSFEKLN